MADDTKGWSERWTMDGVPYYHNSLTEQVTWDKPEEMKSKDELFSDSGRWRWVADPELAWIPVRETQPNPDGSAECETMEGDFVMAPANSPNWPLLKSSLAHLEEDLVLVDNMNEGLIIHNLRERFKKDEIYTNIGTILVSVNPFKRLPLYTPSMIEKYYHSGGNKRLPPHVFGIADSAYKDMIYGGGQNQSILISGESGAGKTEATKQCLAFFAEVAGSENNVEQKIIQANPILEAFGNAKTVRNNNSSRFGKYMEVHFDRHGKIIGARTENYLLEKSRVVYQAQGERNFHIFYQLVCGHLSEQYGVNQPLDSFHYLNQSDCTEADDIDDVKDFEEVLESFDIIGFSAEEKDWLFRVVAAVLKLGNLQFVPTSDESGSVIKDKKLVKEIADLLQVDAAKLEESVLSRWFVVRGHDPTKIPFKPLEARDACDALAKAIYGEVFNWLVRRINESVEVKQGASQNFIGVLDIFGFEIFEMNSFEQLCINFANEKLQQHFNQYTFKLEERVYAQEKIAFDHIEFVDNQPILDMIEKKPDGMLVVLDEEIVMPKGSDETFCRKVFQKHGKSDYLVRNRQKDTAFAINHYAGQVMYDADGFLLKNKDTLYQDLYDVVSGSQHKLLASLFPSIPADSKRKKISLGGQFRRQLSDLMDKLNQTHPHYVRCVKPNNLKQPNIFMSVMSLEQLRYAGVFEAISIRQQGFPFRYTHKEFVRRYKCLALKDDGWLPLRSSDTKALCKELLDITRQDFSSVQIGRTQVLYRAPQQRVLELLRNLSLERVCLIAQSWGRMVLTQLFSRRLRAVRPALLDALKVGNDLPRVEAALDNASETIGSLIKVFNFQMYEITLCKELRAKLLERKRVTELLAEIFPLDPEEHFEALTDAVRQADEIEAYPGTIAQMKTYKDTKAKLELTINRRATRADLREATELAEKERLLAGVQRAEELGIGQCAEVKAAQAMLDRIEKELVVIANLQDALSTGGITYWSPTAKQELDLKGLDAVINEATRFGMKTALGVSLLKAAQMLKKLRQMLSAAPWEGNSRWMAVEALFEGEGDLDALLDTNEELAWAYYETLYRNRLREVLDPLQAAVDTLNEEAIEKHLKSFEEPPALGLDQQQRLQEQEEALAGSARQALEQVKEAKRLLNEANESEDEEQLLQAIDAAAACPVSPEVAAHLLERFATAHLLLALKFHIAEGVREEVGLLLDEALAGATSTVMREDGGKVQELGKDAIIDELNTQYQAIQDALAYARSIGTMETDLGKSALRKGEVSFQLRQSLLARDWDNVEKHVNHAGSLQMDSADVRLARDEIIGRAAAEDVLQKIQESLDGITTPSEEEGHPSEGVLQTCLAQAERLQMKELPQITEGRDLYNQILATRQALQAALVTSMYDDYITLAEEYGPLYELLGASIDALNSAIALAGEFDYRTKEVEDAEHLLYELTLIHNLQTALQAGGYLMGNQPTDVPAVFIDLEPLNEAYGPTDGFDFTTELSHYIVTKAYHIICIRGGVQVLSSDHSHLEEAIKEANEGVGFDTPELLSARELIQVIHDILSRMAEAEEKVEQALLEDAVATAEKYFYENENVERIRQLRDRVIELNEESRQALWNFDKARMEEVYANAKAIRLVTPHLDRIGGYLDYGEEDFLKVEIKKAAEIGDEARKIRLSIRLKEISLDTFGSMLGVLQYKSLRSGKDFAAQKLLTTDRKKLSMGMMYWTKVPIHTSLTEIEDPLLLKLAQKCFKNILGYMMDKKYPYPSTLAQELLQTGIENPPLRSEIYCQIIKQLAEHPVPANKQRGYHLLALCCDTFPSGPDFENYLETYLRNVPEASSKYIAALRDSSYGSAKTAAPSPDQIDSFVSDFFNPGQPTGESRFCVPQPLKTTEYPQEFFDDPEKLFLETEVEIK